MHSVFNWSDVPWFFFLRKKILDDKDCQTIHGNHLPWNLLLRKKNLRVFYKFADQNKIPNNRKVKMSVALLCASFAHCRRASIGLKISLRRAISKDRRTSILSVLPAALQSKLHDSNRFISSSVINLRGWLGRIRVMSCKTIYIMPSAFFPAAQ